MGVTTPSSHPDVGGTRRDMLPSGNHDSRRSL